MVTGVALRYVAPTLGGLVAIHFHDSVTLGSAIVGILVGLAGLAVFGYGVKWKTAYEAAQATAETLRGEMEAYKLRADRLADDLRHQTEQLRLLNERLTAMQDDLVQARTEVARLEERPDLAKVLQLIGEQAVRQDAQAERRVEAAVHTLIDRFNERLEEHDANLNGHDRRAEERQTQIIELLEER